MNDTKVTLTLNLINGIMGYLGTRPFQEVEALVQEIRTQAIPQLPVPEVAAEPAVDAAKAE